MFMGFIRTSTSIVLGILFFLSLFLTGLFLTMNLSLNYKNVESHVTPYIQNSTQNKLTSKQISFAINQSYYKNYNCTLVNCIKQNQVGYLFSKQGKIFWYQKFKLMLILSIILFVSLFFVAKKKDSALIGTGIITIISNLPFKNMSWIKKILPKTEMSTLINTFFTSSPKVFWTMAFIGLGLIILGILFKIFKMGISINNFFTKLKKEDEEEVNEKITNQTEDENKIDEKDNEKELSTNKVKEIVKKEIEKASKNIKNSKKKK